MTQHLFISSKTRLLPRWLAAFPRALIARTLGTARPDVVWWAPERFDADALQGLVASLDAGVPVVVMAGEPSPDAAMQALALGARGYCHTHATPALLEQVALVVLNGGLWLGTELMSRVMGAAGQRLLDGETESSASRLDALTPRERAVAFEVARGATNKEAARTLDITERTVKAHLSAVFEKLGVRDRLQLVLALKHLPRKVGRAA